MPKVVPGSTGEPSYYDRNPTTVTERSVVNVGASSVATTQGWSYTVPSGKAFFIEFAQLRARNDSSTATNNRAGVYLHIIGLDPFIELDLLTGSVTPDQNESLTVGGTGHLSSGEQIAGYHYSDNTAILSNVWVASYLKGTEFDA